MRPTTKDLAKHAGVSLATVDRVLNKRSGVRQKTIDAVNAAIKELGFERNLQAANLAKKRVYRFDFLLPKADGDFLSEIEAQVTDLSKSLKVEGVDVRCRRIVAPDPHKMVALLAKINKDTIDGVAIMATQSPQVRDAVYRLSERGVAVVQLISGQAGGEPHDFVGIDNFAAGATAARLLGGFAKESCGKLMVIADSITAVDSVERRIGFDDVIQKRFPTLDALPTLETHADAARTDMIIANTYRNFPDIVGVYVMSSEARHPIAAICTHSDPATQTIIAHERTAITETHLQTGTVDALIAQNPGHIVRSAVRLLRARLDQRPSMGAQDQIRIEILLKENIGL